VVDPGILKDLIKNVGTAKMENIMQSIEIVLRQGFSGAQILNTAFKIVLEDSSLRVVEKSRMLERIADTERALMEGAKDDLQIMSLFAGFKKIKLQTLN
jgi:DNA polymerase III delta prime subunit